MSVWRPKSIRTRLNVILGATTLVALLVAATALLAIDLAKARRAIEQDLITQADVIALASAPALAFADPRVAQENLSVLRAKPGVVVAALYDERGDLFAAYRPDGSSSVVPPRAMPNGLDTSDQLAFVWRPVVSNRERVGAIYLGVRDQRVRRALEYLGVLAIVMAGSLAAALLLSNRLQRSLTRPILDVSAVARKILRGETVDLRATKSSDDEVGALVDAFNAMLDELGRRTRTLEAANEALRASEARYQLAVRGSSAGLWDWDIAAGTMFHSPRFKSLLGYTEAEFPDVPESIRKLLHADDRERVRTALLAHLRDQVPYQVECRLLDSHGRWRWFFVAGTALWDATGRAYRMAGSVVEVTERKQAEQVLQEANRAKDEFLATLAHELRNPLAPIRTGLEVLRRGTGQGPAFERVRSTMERQLAHMTRLIDDLLDISRINSGKICLEVERIGLAAVVDSAVEIARPAITAGGHELQLDLPGQDIELMGDATRLAQALGNLLNNAAKYTPPNGSIVLGVRREGEEAVLEVQDNGEGIADAMLERIFSLFAQVRSTGDRAQGGLGIGLYLVRTLVTLHGGTVTAASPGPGLGSTFTLRVPCLPPHLPAPASEAVARSAAQAAGLRVLLVDDNVDAAETLSMVLEMEGCELRLVHEGNAVLDAALAFDPDVVLLDIGLPGMSGYEVAQQLRREPRFARTLLVAITGWGAEQDRERARQAGFDHHLTKPVEFQALASLLAAAPRSGRERR